MTSRGPTLPAHEESQIWTEAQAALRQVPEAHARAQKIASELNKHQRQLASLPNGEGIAVNDTLMIEPSADLLAKMENLYQEGVRVAEQEARFNGLDYH
jgi:hypothetical protein